MNNKSNVQPGKPPSDGIVSANGQQTAPNLRHGTIGLLDIITILNRSKLWLILFVLLIGFATAIIVINLVPTYTASVVLSPAAPPSQKSSLVSRFGGLAQLAGIGIGTGGGGIEQSIEVLRSQEFTYDFVQKNNLLIHLFDERWDAKKQVWLPPRKDVRYFMRMIFQTIMAPFRGERPRLDRPLINNEPTMWEAYKVFDRLREVRLDNLTGIAKLSIVWKDPELAAEWANALVVSVNERLRNKAVEESKKNINYLKSEVEKARVQEYSDAIYQLISSEVRSIMLAKGREEFAFNILDRAYPPETPSSPRVLLIIVLAMIGAGFAGIFVVFLAEFIQSERRLRETLLK